MTLNISLKHIFFHEVCRLSVSRRQLLSKKASKTMLSGSPRRLSMRIWRSETAMKLGLITMTEVPSFMNQAVLVRKIFVENGWEVELLRTDQALRYPQQNFDKGIALVPLWARYIWDATRLLAPWFSRTHLLYGPVDGPFQTNISLFQMAQNLRIIVPSEFCRTCLKGNNIPVLDVVPHGINHDDFKFEDIPKYDRLKQLRQRFPDRKILFSNLNPIHRKGFVHLQKALEILHQRIAHKYIFILHTGLEKAKKLNPSITETPNLVIEDQYSKLPFREIALKTVACDVFVFPSLLEGFGEPILEAMAAKKPIVCLDAPAMNELVSEKEAYLFPMTQLREEKWDNGAIAQLHDYDPASLAEAMQHAVEDERESLEKAEAAYKKSLDYDYRKVYSKLVAY